MKPELCTDNGNSHAEDQTIVEQEWVDRHYPAVLESAPFPVLGSVMEITRTLTRVKSDGTLKSDPAIDDNYKFKQEPYHTEGWRNPGWLSVISCFLVNFYVFGGTFTWGIYQRLYIEDVFEGQTDLLRIAFVGTSSVALLLALGMFITPVIQKIGYRRTMMIGTVIAPLGFILASFATELWHVYLSQGILFGLGASFVFCPSITLPSQWFTKRRALATGLAVSGSGIGGVCFSPMIQAIVDSIGYRNCLRVQGGVGFGILSLATSLAVSRYRPPPLEGDSARWYHFYDKTLISRNFVLLLCFSFFVPFAYIVPFFLAPQFVEHIGLEPSTGAVMISVMCATNALCRICLGYLADKIGRFNTLSSFTFSAALFIMLIWQFCTTYTVYVVFCVLYGLTAGGFVSLLPVTTADIVGVENIQRGLGMAYMITVIGNLVGTPIIGLLLKQFNWTVAIQFAGGVTLIASVFIIILRNIMADGKIFVKV